MPPSAPREPSPALPTARLAPYVTATALGSTAYIASFAAASLAAREITGRAELAGLPSAIGTVATAVAIGLLSALMARHGRRPGLLAGLLIAVAGAVASLTSIALAWLPLLLVGSAAIGFGNAALQLSRYAASDLVAPDRRAAAVGTVVWGSTAGAVIGPNLLEPAGALAEAVGRPALQGALTATMLGFALAALVVAVWVRHGRPVDGRDEVPAPVAPPAEDRQPIPPVGRRTLLASTRVRVALIGMVSGQVVMVLIMTMTPVHIHDMGQPLSVVGFVISAHTLGMFALSPLSGRLVSRLGALPVMVSGFAVLLVAALLAAAGRPDDMGVLTLALFLLGYGWNLGFVAGSSMLASGAPLAERIRLQGLTDVLVWTAGAAASATSGLLLEWAGYPVLAAVGGALLILPAIAILVARRSVAATA